MVPVKRRSARQGGEALRQSSVQLRNLLMLLPSVSRRANYEDGRDSRWGGGVEL